MAGDEAQRGTTSGHQVPPQGDTPDDGWRHEHERDGGPAPPPAKSVSNMEHEEVEIYAEKSIRLRTGGGAVLWLAEDGQVVMSNASGAQVLADKDGSVMMTNSTGSRVRIDPTGSVEIRSGTTVLKVTFSTIAATSGAATISAASVAVAAPTSAFAGAVTGATFNGRP